MRVMLGTTKDTPIAIMRSILDLPPMKNTQKVEQIQVCFSAVQNPNNRLHEDMPDTRGSRLRRGTSCMSQAEDLVSTARLFLAITTSRGGDVAQLVELASGMPLTLVQFPDEARDFSPRVNCQCRLSYSVRIPPCAFAYINISSHVKDPVVYARVRWIMETL